LKNLSLLKTLAFFAFFALVTQDAFASTVATTANTDGDFNELFERIGRSFQDFPGLISIAAYLVGIILSIGGLLKLKDFIDEPARTPLKDVAIRFIIGGAFFAFPFVISVLQASIGAQTGNVSTGVIVNSTAGLFGSLTCSLTGGGLTGGILGAISGGSIQELLCNVGASFTQLTGLINPLLYIGGLVLAFVALLQLRDHVISPDRMPVSVPLKKAAVAGIFFAFPFFLDVVYATFSGRNVLIGTDIVSTISSIFSAVTTGSAPASCGGVASSLGSIGTVVGGIIDAVTGSAPTSSVGGLDCMMIRLIADVSGPLQALTSLFCYLAGIIIIIMAVRRMMESADKGVRGPLGVGTFGMLALGGCLLSFNTMLATISASMFPTLLGAAGVQTLEQTAALSYAPGLTAGSLASVNSVLTSVLAFAFLVGMISILRGMFILKDVADGGNASIMAGMTHLLGGGMAVNLGPMITAVQNTLGLTSIGITFT
jgi:hypothetical protein